jgi:hypothetical protein
MMKQSALALISLLSIGALGACGSPGGGSGGRGGHGNEGGAGDEGGNPGTGGTGGKVVPKDAGVPKDTNAPAVEGGAPPADMGGSGGCEGPPESLLCKPLGDMPKSLKDTGFFPTPTDLTKHPAAMREYVPDPPLWSDGMQKQRYLVLPTGMKIDNSDRKAWKFPDGTIFIKTFFDDSGAGGQRKPIETRFIRNKGGTFQFFLYKWNPDGADATLLLNGDDGIGGDINMDQPVPITIKHTEDGRMLMVNGGMPFMHTLPSRQACGQCHEENAMHAQTFIGFDELRLNSKFPKTATRTQLEDFGAGGDLKNSIFTMPIPTDPATITDASNDNGRLLRIKRFVFGNCVHCHAMGSGVFDMRPEVFVANTVNKPTNAQSVEPPAGWMRIKPGFPGQSVIYVQAQRTMIPTMVAGKPVKLRPMPPVGVADVAADQEFLTELAAWITALPK